MVAVRDGAKSFDGGIVSEEENGDVIGNAEPSS